MGYYKMMDERNMTKCKGCLIGELVDAGLYNLFLGNSFQPIMRLFTMAYAYTSIPTYSGNGWKR